MVVIPILLIKYAFVQGILLSLWLMVRKRQLIMAAFFLSLSYLLLVYLLEVEGWYRVLPHLIWTNVPIWFLLAPLLFLQARHTMSADVETRQWKKLLHFLPAAGALLYMLPFYTLSAPEKVHTFEQFYSQESIADYVQTAYLLQMGLYAFFGKRLLRSHIRKLKDQLSSSDIIHLGLLSSTYLMLGAYILVAAVLSVLLRFFADTGLNLYPLAFLLLSCVPIIATLVFLNAPAGEQEMAGQYRLILEEQEYPLSQKYARSSLSEEDLREVLSRVEVLISEQQLYRQPELKLSDLSELGGISSHHISQALNQVLGKSFFGYINAQRVEAVKRDLEKGKHLSLTLMAIAENCGFRSESSFYRIFKSHTGLTPKAYIRRQSE